MKYFGSINKKEKLFSCVGSDTKRDADFLYMCGCGFCDRFIILYNPQKEIIRCSDCELETDIKSFTIIKMTSIKLTNKEKKTAELTLLIKKLSI